MELRLDYRMRRWDIWSSTSECLTNRFQGNTPLHLAAINGHAETVHALLDEGAGVTVTNSLGNTPAQVKNAFSFDIYFLKWLCSIEQLFQVCSLNGHSVLATMLFEKEDAIISAPIRSRHDSQRGTMYSTVESVFSGRNLTLILYGLSHSNAFIRASWYWLFFCRWSWWACPTVSSEFHGGLDASHDAIITRHCWVRRRASLLVGIGRHFVEWEGYSIGLSRCTPLYADSQVASHSDTTLATGGDIARTTRNNTQHISPKVSFFTHRD